MVLFVSYPFDKRRMCLLVMYFPSCEMDYLCSNRITDSSSLSALQNSKLKLDSLSRTNVSEGK